jgi:hypothetical protein
MKTTVTLNGITKEVELTSEQAKLFEVTKTGWERVERGEDYYFNNYKGSATVLTEGYSNTDKKLYGIGNYFSTEEQAVKQGKIDSLRRRMERWASEHSPDGEWDGRSQHWSVVFKT